MQLNCRGKIIDLKVPKVMGILNITPDSFYDGSTEMKIYDYVEKALQMVNQGASIIDIGGMSSRSGAAIISSFEERNRVIPVIKELVRRIPNVIMSLDTIHSDTAKAGIDEGVSIINDISGGLYDSKMISAISNYNVPLVQMHMRGTPQNMQSQTEYVDVANEVFTFLLIRAKEIIDAGVSQVILDPGFGFSKNLEQNYILLKELDKLTFAGLPVLVGLSRKSMIQKKINTNAAQSLNGTTALNMVALMKGASILRVHDVKEAMETVLLYQALQS